MRIHWDLKRRLLRNQEAHKKLSDSDKEKSTSTSEEDAKILDQPKVNSTELNATLRPATKKSSAGPNSFHGSTSTPTYASYKYQPTSNVITLLAKLFF